VTKQAINPPAVFQSLEHGFSQAIVASGSRTLYVSGQTAWEFAEAAGRRRRPRGAGEQAFENLRTVVEAAGAHSPTWLRAHLRVDYRPEKAVSVGEPLENVSPQTSSPRPPGWVLRRWRMLVF
jgi:enamine deaminase RidA (YjgF/YER057c/UK114 family)